jgi:hypothetical protein
MGELRIGMSEDEASRILHAKIEDVGGVNMLRERRISTTVGGVTFAAAASSKHVVYLVSSQQFFPTADLGRQAAQQMVQQYHKEFGSSRAVSNDDRDGVKYQNWSVPGGSAIWSICTVQTRQWLWKFRTTHAKMPMTAKIVFATLRWVQ